MLLSTSGSYEAAVSSLSPLLWIVLILRYLVWWVVAQTVIVFPILFPIHYKLSPDNDPNFSKTSLLRGDISSLIQQEVKDRGRKLLWIHLVLIYWVTLSWIAAVSVLYLSHA
jgi:hypothetical protein